jgi:hypothetical protein
MRIVGATCWSKFAESREVVGRSSSEVSGMDLRIMVGRPLPPPGPMSG